MGDKGKKDCLLVAAIDFGTTFTGYAYSFKGSHEKEPLKMITPQKWEGDAQLSQKTVTCILFDEHKKFHSFGYPAETKYNRIARREDIKKWYFFKRFKMKLHNKEIHRDIMIKAHNGEEMRAMTVFGASIRYMKTHLLENLEKNTGSAVEHDRIHWVLTVPAIWSDPAKQFMREAANEAGIDGSLLTIALEPEAASLFCQRINEDQVKTGQARGDKNISQPGTKFMCIDLGGGTADITVHKRQANGGTSELYPATGDHLGGTRVDEAFHQLLIQLIGANILKKLETESPYDFLSMMLNFEKAKRTFDGTSELVVTVPIKLEQYYTDETGENLEEAIEKSTYADTVEWMSDKVIIAPEQMQKIFDTCAQKLVEHVKKLLTKKEVKGTDVFLMVGGFSEADIMQKAIRDNFKGVKLIVPPDTGLAVVKGAVLFGHDPIVINPRRAKYTYGINISPPFDSSQHPESHRVSVGGHDRCRDVFKVYIHKGEEMHIGVPKCGKHISLKPDQDEMLLKVFISDQKEPKFVDPPHGTYIGKLVVKLPKKGAKIKVEVQMMIGETEMHVEAEELETHTKYKAFFDFL